MKKPRNVGAFLHLSQLQGLVVVVLVAFVLANLLEQKGSVQLNKAQTPKLTLSHLRPGPGRQAFTAHCAQLLQHSALVTWPYLQAHRADALVWAKQKTTKEWKLAKERL